MDYVLMLYWGDVMEQHNSVNLHLWGISTSTNLGTLEALKTLSEPQLWLLNG